jgi:Terpene cyclase DEP1
MVSLLVHALLGLAVIGWIIASNPKIYARPASGPWLSPLECVYYAVGIASIVLGWYFNIKFVAEAHGQGNLVSGPASYPHFLRSQFASSAAGSGISDYLIANVILLPLFTIVDGLRRGIRRPWLFFLCSFFTSFSFPLAFYFATMERQRRHEQAAASAPKIAA